MTTATAINDDGSGSGNANATAENAGTAAHRQSNEDVEARLAGVEALLDQSARMIKTLHAAVVLSAGRPPVQAELDLAADARETLAAVARALPPKALLGGGGSSGEAGGGEGGGQGERLATVEKTLKNMGMLPPPFPVVAGVRAGAGQGAAVGAEPGAETIATQPQQPQQPQQQEQQQQQQQRASPSPRQL